MCLFSISSPSFPVSTPLHHIQVIYFYDISYELLWLHLLFLYCKSTTQRPHRILWWKMVTFTSYANFQGTMIHSLSNHLLSLQQILWLLATTNPFFLPSLYFYSFPTTIKHKCIRRKKNEIIVEGKIFHCLPKMPTVPLIFFRLTNSKSKYSIRKKTF